MTIQSSRRAVSSDPKTRIPLVTVTRDGGRDRARIPALKPWQIRYLFDLAERDRTAHPRKKATRLHYGGRPFRVDGTILGLRLWWGKILISRRYGFGL